ncbi:hypothetical protein [Janibacter sp. Soil728]|uniref:hypothetical protein n=1 Tax=Janibacter sp. Soil728 TaxID=1736393 RepID=UPI000A4C0C10|nr:hypothetical protein [Janibacter sp. Soil728]
MARRPGAPLMIDCGTCPVQHVGCADCMVTALGSPTALADPGLATQLPLDRREREVVSRLVAAGLVSAETANEARAVHEPRSGYDELRRFAG